METILITGATGQVGAPIARHFLAQGHRVLALTRDRAAAAARFGASSEGELIPVEGDLAREGEAGRLAESLSREGWQPSALVNAARDAAYLKTRPDGTVGRAEWLAELTLDVVAAYEVTMALLSAPGARLRSVVNVSSIYGMVSPRPSLYENPAWIPPVHYGAAKAALIHLTRDLAARLAPGGIAVNCVSFGGVQGRSEPGFQERYGANTPAGGMLEEGDLATCVGFLAGLRGASLTGQNVAVDGGWTLW